MTLVVLYKQPIIEKTTVCPNSSFFSNSIAMYEPKSIWRARRLLNL